MKFRQTLVRLGVLLPTRRSAEFFLKKLQDLISEQNARAFVVLRRDLPHLSLLEGIMVDVVSILCGGLQKSATPFVTECLDAIYWLLINFGPSISDFGLVRIMRDVLCVEEDASAPFTRSKKVFFTLLTNYNDRVLFRLERQLLISSHDFQRHVMELLLQWLLLKILVSQATERGLLRIALEGLQSHSPILRLLCLDICHSLRYRGVSFNDMVHFFMDRGASRELITAVEVRLRRREKPPLFDGNVPPAQTRMTDTDIAWAIRDTRSLEWLG